MFIAVSGVVCAVASLLPRATSDPAVWQTLPLGTCLGLALAGLALWTQQSRQSLRVVQLSRGLLTSYVLTLAVVEIFFPLDGSGAATAGLLGGPRTPLLSVTLLAALAASLLLSPREGDVARSPLPIYLAGAVVAVGIGLAMTFGFPLGGAGALVPDLAASIAFILLGLAVLLSRPKSRVVRVLFAPTASGRMVRRLLVGAVLVPAILSRLCIFFASRGVIELDHAALLLAGGLLACGFLISVYIAETAIDQEDSHASAGREKNQIASRLELQAAQLQEMVSLRTRELFDANASLRAAAESNALLALAANHITNGVCITDALGRVEWTNAALERLTGFRLEDIKGRKPGSYLHGSGTDTAAIARMRQAIRVGDPCKAEILNYSKTGQSFWQLVDIQPVRDQSGRVINFISVHTDISTQRLAQQRLETLNQRLELATRAADLGVWEWNSTAKKFLWDARMMVIYGVIPREFDGSMAMASYALHPEDRDRVLAAFEAAQSSDDNFDQSFRLLRPDGSTRYIHSQGIVQRDASGKLISITGTCRDITAEREASHKTAALNERLKLALSSSNYGVWELDVATEDLVWDDRMAEIYGVRRESPSTQRERWRKALHPEDREAVAARARDVISGRLPSYDTEFRIIRADGSIRHIEAHGYLQRDSRGQPLRLVGLNRDITAERQLREALRVAEHRWQLALQSTNDGVWDWDIEAGVRYHDERWARMLGYDLGEIPTTQAGWRDLLHPDDAAACEAVARIHIEGRAAFYQHEHRMRAKNGEWKWILDRGKVVSRANDGRALRMVGTHTDITERKWLEQRLRQTEELASRVSQLAHIGGWELDLATSHLIWSPIVGQIFEFEPTHHATLGEMLDLFLPEARATLQNAMREASTKAAAFDLELPAITAKGRRIWARVLGMPEFWNGRAESIQGAIQDITARHDSEESRRQLEVQLFQAQKMETLGTLAGGIAHDFNNLLTGIIGYHELAADSLEPDHPARLCLAEARNASLRARELVEQILTFGRQSVSEEHGPMDLALVLDEARRFLRATIPASITITTDANANCPRVLADATQIHQVILNLGSNASHAMRAHGGELKIVLTAAEISSEQAAALGGVTAGSYACISVSDNGHGMDNATLRRIFDPFFTTKNTREGTGLGLAVVHGIVRAHRGAIDVKSQVGVGSTFHIYLPAAQEENILDDSGFLPAPRGVGQFVGVVDDEEVVGSCTKLALESKGYRAIAYDSAELFLAALRQGDHPFDVLLTDQTMPGMQGTELAAAARLLRPNFPVVIMSGYFSKISSQALDELGRVELLAKPFTTDELARAVNRGLYPAKYDA